MRTESFVAALLSTAVAACSATSAARNGSASSDAGANVPDSGEARDAVAPDAADGATATPAFVGTYACTGFQSQSCSAPGAATGTYDAGAACPLVIVQSGASTVTVRQADGVSLEWQVTGSRTASLAGAQTVPGTFPNQYGPGTVSSFAVAAGDLLASGAMLQLEESGSFDWTGDGGSETCQFNRRFMGTLAGDAGESE